MTRDIAEETATILLDIGAVQLRPDRPFTWTSGIQSPIYCDNRLLLSHPKERKQICEFFCKLLPADIQCIAGVATGAIPHAAWIADRLNLPMVYIRGGKKDHGKQNQVEGKVPAGVKAVVIEDLISTGGSSVEAVLALREAGAKVEHCLAIFQYGFAEAIEKFAAINCRLTTLTDFATLLTVAKERGIIQPQQEALLQKFSADPRGWL